MKKKHTVAPWCEPLCEKLSELGGERGIRTPDTDLCPYDGLANRCLQPLGHLSTPSIVPKSLFISNTVWNPRILDRLKKFVNRWRNNPKGWLCRSILFFCNDSKWCRINEVLHDKYWNKKLTKTKTHVRRNYADNSVRSCGLWKLMCRSVAWRLSGKANQYSARAL